MNNKTKLSFEQIETIAMALPHVVGVSDGQTADETPIVKVLIDCPVEEFELPSTLVACDIVLHNVGNIRSQ